MIDCYSRSCRPETKFESISTKRLAQWLPHEMENSPFLGLLPLWPEAPNIGSEFKAKDILMEIIHQHHKDMEFYIKWTYLWKSQFRLHRSKLQGLIGQDNARTENKSKFQFHAVFHLSSGYPQVEQRWAVSSSVSRIQGREYVTAIPLTPSWKISLFHGNV